MTTSGTVPFPAGLPPFRPHSGGWQPCQRLLAAAAAVMGWACDTPAGTPDRPAPCAPVTYDLAQDLRDEDLPHFETPERMAPGVGVGDLDNDGDLDVLAAFGGGSMLLRNEGGALERDDRATVDGGPLPGAQAVALADLDGDGNLDAWLGRWGTRDLVLRGDGRGSFTSEAIDGSEGATYTTAFADADGDGDLDAVIAAGVEDLSAEAIIAGEQTGDPNLFYVQGADGRFVLAEGALPPEAIPGITYQIAWLDADQDQDLDLYVGNDGGPYIEPNHLLLNDGTGRFELAPECGCEIAMFTMGAGVGDANADGLPDVYLSDVGGPDLILGLGDGTFVDATLSLGADVPPTEHSMTSWGTAFLDADRDARMDLVITFGQSGDAFKVAAPDPDWVDGDEQPDLLLLGQDDGTFAIATESGFGDPGRTRAVAVGDFDRDGRPDMVTGGKHFFQVWMARGGCDTGITVRADAGGRNRQGLGARVDVLAAGRSVTQWILPSTTGSSSAHELYFGLDGAESADQVTLTWPDGTTETRGAIPSGSVVAFAR